ncbi:hypothetical protein [Paraliomyxa miuraensis]|uniref:hypothetical protein n=1 Tax=Paraliomyxa miuraensis TaxID=376150 RepID=UPI00225ABA61|nr:hypothetical protein [Paraliomyxa miuraensis]MCX4243841.1 hypothetical protein [Paraliomyxa miuraensis]
MRWVLRDGPRQLVLSTERGAPFEGAILVEDSAAAASTLRNLAYEPANMKGLRHVHMELVNSPNERSRADTLVLAELMAQVAAKRLFVFEQGRVLNFTYDVPPPEDEEDIWEEAEPLMASEPPPTPEPAPSPAVLAQAAALKQAASAGAPFCEE